MSLMFAAPKYSRMVSPSALSDDDQIDNTPDHDLNLRAMVSRIRQRSRYMRYYPRNYAPSKYSSKYATMFDNKYSFLLDSYQPTLDYLRNRTQDIQSRINNLNYLTNYKPSYLPHSYSPTSNELNILSRAETARAEQNYISSHVFSRSPFHYAKTVPSALIFKRLHPEDDIIEREKHHQLERDDDLKWILNNDYMESTRRRGKGSGRLYDLESIGNDDMSYELKRAMRGQSPNTIAALLLADSEKRIQRGRRRQYDFNQSALAALHSNVHERSFSPVRRRNYDLHSGGLNVMQSDIYERSLSPCIETIMKPSSKRRLKWHFGLN